MSEIKKIECSYLDSYEKIFIVTKEEVNAYLPDGNTLLIATVRKKGVTPLQKKEKIKWLLSNGANINQKDYGRRYFPPLTHAIQMKDYEVFAFLLKECHTNPNISSRNPYF